MIAVVAPVVLAERPAEGVGLVRINRPDARNALNLEVRKLLAKHLTEMGDDPAIRCIVLTGDLISAKEAFDMGLVSEIVADGEVEKRAIAMAQQIAELPPLAIEQVKECVLCGMDASLDTGLALETKAIQMLFASQDQKEGMAAFIEKRKAKFQGR